MKLNKLTKESNKNIDFIFQHYPLHIKNIYVNTYFMKLLYTLLDRANDAENIKTEYKISSVVQPKLDNGKFLDPEIIDSIQKTHYTCHTFKLLIDATFCKVDVFAKDEIDVDEYMSFFKVILYLCCKNSERPLSSYNFQLVLTDFKKSLPTNEMVRAKHINTGYSIHSQNKVVLFRREEIIKVFIHECFHVFCLDFSDVGGINYRDMFLPLFHVQSDYLIFESLCEFWARTINAALISYYTKPNATFKEFEKLLTININIERTYSLCKLKEYLSKFELTYQDIINGTTKRYSEDTNGFCYYVLSAILLHYYEQTMNWFIKNNDTLLQFKKKNEHIYLFYHYIKLMYNQDDFLQQLETITHYKFDNNLMSVFEIQI
jgi:hypothetical protein